MKKRALRKAAFATLTRFLGWFFAVAAGSIIPKDVISHNYSNAIFFILISLILMFFSEYFKEGIE